MKYLYFFLALAAGIGVWILLYPNQNPNIQFFDSQDESIEVIPKLGLYINMTLGFIMLMIGIFLGTWTRALMKKREAGLKDVHIGILIKKSFKSIDLWISILASPLLYGSILSASNSINLSSFIFLALQTGFSSNIVVSTFLGGSLENEDSNKRT
ncbi:MAG: hypothetical protein JXQ93_02065 [Flavobacteriaceae bacterium]